MPPRLLSSATVRIWAALVAGYALFVLAAHWGPPALARIGAPAVMVPFFSVHLFHKLGVPGLLEHGGACGWGWCSPTAFGWAFIAVLWLGAAWLLAWGLAAVASWRRRDRS